MNDDLLSNQPSEKRREPIEPEISDPASEAELALAKKLEQSLHPGPYEPRELAKVLAEFVSVEIRSSFQGPLPPPKMLKEYETTVPGLAGRIVERSDKEQAFRHELT